MSYIEHLAKDKKLAKTLANAPIKLKKEKQVYLHLCGSIMSQQLSTKVAAVIWNRFLDLYEDRSPTPEQILATPYETLRGIGLSNAKARYIQNVAQFALEHGMEWKQLKKMSDEEVIAHLTQIKGVGRWTTEMLLMFALGREDVFAADDLGIQQAMIKLYKLDNTHKKAFKEKMQKISAKWSPYRTYACLHLWKWKDIGV
ncbi:DNA-3-methyladenine glycosylase family protein [Flavihumibacter fluvii]|uniref:DNA-3-methyladenine glycosylase family protein n=1 Tax=Flavihumibacter fluvii TaxID=2838157 RepID=UPI001BDF1236|nr:DNA-3-methyladenine glycosylase 2 family protein [Flavihumibacter fluvii]ULQ51387.1 DNA-3-methyladenine glycosylase 2 family protein [Flavihumibacter fluvii]